jgi:hypothetical protein
MRRRLRADTGPRLRWQDFSGYERLIAFITLWSPELNRARGRWENWREYLKSWEAVRVEFRRQYPERRRAPFAERARLIAREHGVDALERTPLERIQDYGGADW